MTYQLTIWNSAGERIGTQGPFGNVASARQAMLDSAKIADLPVEEPFFAPAIGVVEGWFLGRTEYLIEISA